MKQSKEFIIKIPDFPSSIINNQKLEKQKNNNIDELRKAIKSQYDELVAFQDIEINEKNINNIEKLIFATEDLISNCMNDEIYSGNRDQFFVNLIFISHKLSLRIETYKIEEKIKDLDIKNKFINENQEKLQQRQEKTEEQSNNLVYNILGFIASFSIVSAVVGVVTSIKGTINIMIFMAFTILLLLTTLIALKNFYGNNKKKNILQNNYFLWIIVAVMLIVLCILSIVRNNKDNIYNYLDNKVEEMIKEIMIEKENIY